MFAARTAGSDIFKLIKEALLSKVDKSKNELSAQTSNEHIAELAELLLKYDADVDDLKENLCNKEERADDLYVRADFQ